MTLLSLKNVSVEMGQNPTLHNISFDIDAGEIVTVVGPNGSGKSTLLKTIIGAVDLASGTLTKAPGLKIGYVPQRLHIDPSLPMTVKRFLSIPKPVNHIDAHAALDEAGAEHLCYSQMSTLSGGQFQRVLLARAILTKPDLLLLDEATQGLDQIGSADFYTQIEHVRQKLGCAVMMVSHELHVVMAASDRVICLNGHICCAGSPEHVASAPEYNALFGAGTQGALALYKHQHDHRHDEFCAGEHH